MSYSSSLRGKVSLRLLNFEINIYKDKNKRTKKKNI